MCTLPQERLSCMVYSVFRRPLPCNPSTAHMCLSHRCVRNINLLSACTGDQIRASQCQIRLLQARVADVLVDHVTAGRARSVADLRQQCAALNGSPTLRLLVGQRARNAGFDLSDNINNRANFYDFERLLHSTLLADRRYIKLNVMGFVATACQHRRVGSRPWWRHHCPSITPGEHWALYLLRAPAYSTSTPLPPYYNKIFGALRHVSPHLHRNCPRSSRITPRFNSPPSQLPALIDQGAIVSIYSAAGAVSAIHLYFYNCARPDDTNVTAWASSPYGHFELLLPPGEAKTGRKVTSSRLKKGMGIESAVPRVPPCNLPCQSVRLWKKCCSKKSSGRGQRGTINFLMWDLVLSAGPSNSN